MTDFAKKYGFAMADSDSSDDEPALFSSRKQQSPPKIKSTSLTEKTKENMVTKAKEEIIEKPAGKFNNLLKGMLSSDSEEDEKDDFLAKYRAKKI